MWQQQDNHRKTHTLNEHISKHKTLWRNTNMATNTNYYFLNAKAQKI
jgi:hypothetical protein